MKKGDVIPQKYVNTTFYLKVHNQIFATLA